MPERNCIVMAGFILDQGTTIHSNYESEPVKRGIERFYRDMDMVFMPLQKGAETLSGKIILEKKPFEAEKYFIRVKSCHEIVIELPMIWVLFTLYSTSVSVI